MQWEASQVVFRTAAVKKEQAHFSSFPFVLVLFSVGSTDGRPAQDARRCRVSEKTSRPTEDQGEA